MLSNLKDHVADRHCCMVFYKAVFNLIKQLWFFNESRLLYLGIMCYNIQLAGYFLTRMENCYVPFLY